MLRESIVFGGGCFWCTEAVFKMLRGVESVEPGYAGGTTPNPTYAQVCSGRTGHAEVIKIDFDAALVAVEDLFAVFFATHDPTTLNRQGNDVGTQYRSAIFYTTDAQKMAAEKYIAELESSAPGGSPIVTEVTLLDMFYPAEEEHRNYYARNKDAAYCQVIINPKLKKAKERFKELLA